ncbi:RT0821/Lpp0805 family surface protein [Oceanibacterium hippocampi]|uniref:17 kDa surface antigen n=1 Tax=Oceanibacterium hippocampi TaxID=745714 RepID=A0A1Y5SA60_9PROT|nr:RT0821/Lpp0805 family surface protein [Oceanibacterium hippocampi]SLN36017.1 hypothetical protein OCH7691_01446 [Oceanibacterium hippocampi]
MRIGRMIVAGLVALSLAGCTSTAGEKETAGTVLGGVGGALLGSQVGHGTGRLIGVAVGTFLGAALGGEIGRSLDRADKAALERAQNKAYNAPIGEPITWNNPDSGNHGTVTPLRDGTSSSGKYCREFQQEIIVGGERQNAYGVACRQPDGSWRIVQ